MSTQKFMKQQFPQQNNLRYQNEEEIWQSQNYYSIQQIYYLDYSSQQNSFDLESNHKYSFTSFDPIIYEPEYFLNTYSFNASKMKNEFASTSTQLSFQDNHINYLAEQRSQSIIKFYNSDAFNQSEQSHLQNLNQKEDLHIKHSEQEKGISQDLRGKTNFFKSSSNQNENNNCNQNIKTNQSQFNVQEYVNGKETQEYFLSQQQTNKQYEEIQNNQMTSSIKQEKLMYNVNQQNSLKNIVSAFISSEMKYCEIVSMKALQFQNYKKQLIGYVKNHSFNQYVVKYLTTHKFYSLLLLNYLENESTEWLNNSKVADKEEVKAQVIYLITTIKNQTSNLMIIN